MLNYFQDLRDGDFYTEFVLPHERYSLGECPAEDPLMPVRGARAHLSRNGDIVRAVVRTRITGQ